METGIGVYPIGARQFMGQSIVEVQQVTKFAAVRAQYQSIEIAWPRVSAA